MINKLNHFINNSIDIWVCSINEESTKEQKILKKFTKKNYIYIYIYIMKKKILLVVLACLTDISSTSSGTLEHL